jgi:hypothetical protein
LIRNKEKVGAIQREKGKKAGKRRENKDADGGDVDWQEAEEL